VERNPVRAKAVKRAEDWRWGSCFVRHDRKHPLRSLPGNWPIDRPKNWIQWVNEPQTKAEEATVHEHIVRNRPYGNGEWTLMTAKALDLEASLRPRGRPTGWRKPKNALF
jgi:putative transposase